MKALDLNADEQKAVRAALHFLRRQCGGWKPLARALACNEVSLSGMAGGHRPVSPRIAFRTARFVKVGVDDVLTGRFPAPGTCPFCGHRQEDAARSVDEPER